MAHAPDRLRSLLDSAAASNQCLMMPGAFNALCGLAIRQAGFEACYVSGAATSVCAGVPDVGILTLDHFARLIREIVDACGLPLIADADTGFGESEMVRRTVVEYARAGAAGLHLEDQVFPKRCGHLDGKRLIPLEHSVEKIAAAVNAAKSARDLIICARTDARGVEGFDAAVDRAAAYVQAGAGMIFPEGLASEQEFADFAQRLRNKAGATARYHLLANMTEFGKTPIIPAARLGEMGYSCVIFPVSMLRTAMGAVARALEQLKREGTVAGFVDQMQTREQLYGLINYKPGVEWNFPARM
ncbi:MAG: isocitrate lyase/phosphoenolpyruvate mutase family protein [Phycisphaeraceae bacterium]|nr:isocitrate lyase/phosphoenolpyruvate mutase family protein [Phycisphaeraceae bacterium]